jgi:RNA polymerase sigma-70 factor (ECF subfamily)
MDNRPARNGPGRVSGSHDNLRRVLAAAYDACAGQLFRYAAMVLADPNAAEDVVQQVFAKLASRGRFQDIRATTAYLRQAVRNECFRALKHRSRIRQAAEERVLLEALPAPNRPELREELRQELERALKALTPQQREVVHMKIYEKMTFPQIAQVLGVPVNTAASRYRYALAHLRELLGPHTKDEL